MDKNLFREVIQKRHLGSIPEMLDEANCNTSERREVAAIIRESLSSLELLDWTQSWASQGKTSRKLACAIVAACYPVHPRETLELLLSLADDPYWAVREEITWAFAEVMNEDFDTFYPRLKKLVCRSSENVRRAIAVAAQRVGKSRNPAYAHPLFQLIEPLLSDQAGYVRKNLGPFALGDGLVKYYPEVGFEYLHKWSANTEAQVRWNVAMSVSSTAGFRHPHEATNLLEELARDERKYVRGALIAALKRLAGKHPEIVRTAMANWQLDQSTRYVYDRVIESLDD
jgi:3-methyladenine DNA glycosylase AlkC